MSTSDVAVFCWVVFRATPIHTECHYLCVASFALNLSDRLCFPLSFFLCRATKSLSQVRMYAT